MLNVVVQALLSHGIITHAQYMNFMYMKNVMSQFKRENEGSVIAEVGSEHCHSDGHITDTEEGEVREERESHSESEINVLKECLVRQASLRLLNCCIVAIYYSGYNHCSLAATKPPALVPRAWIRIRNLNADPDPFCSCYNNYFEQIK